MTPYSSPRAAPLERRAKAAIIVRLLLSEGLRLPLGQLPEEMQSDLARAMAGLRYVDRVTLRAVIEEFVTELDAVGLAFPGGLRGALDTLEGTISEGAAARLRRQAGLGESADPWARIGEIDTGRLVPLMMEESIEVGAIVLAKLRVAKAAELLGQLPGERARRITFAVSRTSAVSPETVERIGQAVLGQLESETPGAFSGAPVQRVGAILNSSPAATRDAMLAALQEEDEGFAEEVRRAIFTFANIPDRISPRDIPKITREVEGPILVRALAAAAVSAQDKRAGEFILAGMSQRMAAQMREDMDAAGKIRPQDGEAAMSEIVAAIRALESAGEILLTAEED